MNTRTFLKRLRKANIERAKEWPGVTPENDKAAFRVVEFCEEVGEVCGAVKKLYRAHHGMAGNEESPIDRLAHLSHELGDVVITLDRLREAFGMDLSEDIGPKYERHEIQIGPIDFDRLLSRTTFFARIAVSNDYSVVGIFGAVERLAACAGLDLHHCTVHKFNYTSQKLGLKTMMDAD